MLTAILDSPALSAKFLIGDDREARQNVVWPADGPAATVRGRMLTPNGAALLTFRTSGRLTLR